MKWNALLLLVASAAASVEREEPYLGSYQVHPECWVCADFWYIAAASCHSDFFKSILSNVGQSMNNRMPIRNEINWLVSASTTILYVHKRKESKTQAMDLFFFSGRRFPSKFEIFISTLFVPPLWTGTFHFTPWKCIWNIWTLNERENTKCKALLTRYSRELTSQ